MVFDIFDELWLVVSEEDKLSNLIESPSKETVFPKGESCDLPKKLGALAKDTFQRKNVTLPIHRKKPDKLGRMCRRWSETDDVFLTGIVMDTYRRRHSLKPYRGEKGSKRAALRRETLVWQGIHQRYEVARKRYLMLTGLWVKMEIVECVTKKVEAYKSNSRKCGG